MKKLTILILLVTATTWAQPNDALSSARNSAVDATAYARLVDILEVGIESMNPRQTAVLITEVITGGSFPKDATGEWNQSTRVNIQAAKWNVLLDAAGKFAVKAVVSGWKYNNKPEGVDSNIVEWAIQEANPSQSLADRVRDYYSESARTPLE